MREALIKVISLANPLSKPIIIKESMITCEDDNITIKPLPLKIPEK